MSGIKDVKKKPKQTQYLDLQTQIIAEDFIIESEEILDEETGIWYERCQCDCCKCGRNTSKM